MRTDGAHGGRGCRRLFLLREIFFRIREWEQRRDAPCCLFRALASSLLFGRELEEGITGEIAPRDEKKIDELVSVSVEVNKSAE